MKRNGDSLYWQNMQLYAWGVLVNGLGLSVADARHQFQVQLGLSQPDLPLLIRLKVILRVGRAPGKDVTRCRVCLARVHQQEIPQSIGESGAGRAASADSFAGRASVPANVPSGVQRGMRAQDGLWMSRLFRGYDAVTLLVVANMAFSGLLVSWVMKFADSIMKARRCMPLLSCLNLVVSRSSVRES